MSDNTEPSPPEVLGITDGKKALYHCNYCNKDISGKVRIKCVICSDFDLCVECFSVGAEVHPHKSNHPYRVMDNLAFPLICPEWNAGEEMLLLEVVACAKCNSKKGQKTLEEVNMKLMKAPKAPKDYDILAIPLTNHAIKMLKIRKGMPEEWRQYLSKPYAAP